MANLRVAIIGAGSAGLAMCKCLKKEPQIDFVAFEKCDKIGGVWLYTKDDKERSWHTAMYKNLRTNLPKEVMAFPEYLFPEELPSFLARKTVLQYLEDFADHFDLMKHIRLQHEVTLVKPLRGGDAQMWQVTTKDLKNGTFKSETFDAVVVCNGHFSVPKCPDIPRTPPGSPPTVIHSVDYNDPNIFEGQTVVVLGAGSSGVDICTELSEHARQVYFVHRGNKIASKMPENVEEILGTLKRCLPDGSLEINDEMRAHADAVVLCTGYNYSFPFLAPECNIEVRNNRVTSLYKHVFCTAFPRLSFIGLCLRICPFPQFALQAEWIASVLTGRKVLPSREEMMRDEKEDYEERVNLGIPLHKMHLLDGRQWRYNNMLAELAGVAALSPAVHSLYDHVAKLRTEQLSTYRNSNFRLNGNEWFEIKRE